MIIVIGAVYASGSDAEVGPAGLASAVAQAAVTEGSAVELVARVGDDPVGDAVLLAIAASGIGHVATLRDPARTTPIDRQVEDDSDPEADPGIDPPAGDAAAPASDLLPTLDGADVGLALRYLTDYRVIVTVHPSSGVLAAAASAASYAGAHLIVVTDPVGDPDPGSTLPADSLVLAADAGAVGVGATIGRYAAAVDQGAEPAAAFAATLGATEAAVETV